MYNYIFKICVFGDYNTGKTSFLNCLQEMDYVRTYEPTIGVEYSTKIFNLEDDKKAKVTFWDCAGQERFMSITENFFRKVTGGMLFFDVSNRESYNNVLNWITKFRNLNSSDIPLLLVGNKIDKHRIISKNDALILATDFNLKYIEVSVKTKENVLNALNLLIDSIYENKDENPNIENCEEEEEEETPLLLNSPKPRYCTNCCIF